MNDVILNWKKLKKFIKSEKTDNSINGNDRGYTDKEIQRILEYSDQRLKTAFLILTSTGIRIQTCIDLGQEYSIDKIPVSLYTLKSVGIDPGFSSSSTGIVVLEHIKPDNIKDKIRVIETYYIEKGVLIKLLISVGTFGNVIIG